MEFLYKIILQSGDFPVIMIQMTTEKIIIFIGPQGSGKGTQAQILVAKINAEYIEMGAQLRKIAAQDTEFGSLIRNILEEGKLVDNQNWGSIIRDQIAKIQANRPIILDGSPRNIEQAHILIDYLHSIGRNNIATIYISVPRQESLRRLFLCLILFFLAILLRANKLKQKGW